MIMGLGFRTGENEKEKEKIKKKKRKKDGYMMNENESSKNLI